MIRTIGEGGINWNWYLCADFNVEDKTCHIFYYDRWHKYEDRGSKHPKAEWIRQAYRPFEILEDNKRNVYGIKLEGIEYIVLNSANVFSYRDMTHYVSEQPAIRSLLVTGESGLESIQYVKSTLDKLIGVVYPSIIAIKRYT